MKEEVDEATDSSDVDAEKNGPDDVDAEPGVAVEIVIASIAATENLLRRLDLLLGEKKDLQLRLEQAFTLIDAQSVAVLRAENTIRSLERMCAYLGERMLAAQTALDSNDEQTRNAVVLELRQSSLTARALMGSLGGAATFFFGGMSVQAALNSPDVIRDDLGARIINVYEATDACEQVGSIEP